MREILNQGAFREWIVEYDLIFAESSVAGKNVVVGPWPLCKVQLSNDNIFVDE